jgi:hypothetical protein
LFPEALSRDEPYHACVEGFKLVEQKLMGLIVYYAFHGIKSNSNRHDAILRNLPYLGISLVGIGSAVFHSTLINYLQWCKPLFDPPFFSQDAREAEDSPKKPEWHHFLEAHDNPFFGSIRMEKIQAAVSDTSSLSSMANRFRR